MVSAAAELDALMVVPTRIDSANSRRPASHRTCKNKHTYLDDHAHACVDDHAE